MSAHSSPLRLDGASWHAGVDLEAPNPARIYDYLLLRHEALNDRVGVRDPHRWTIAVV